MREPSNMFGWLIVSSFAHYLRANIRLFREIIAETLRKIFVCLYCSIAHKESAESGS